MIKSPFTVILRDFNARSHSWCSDDIASYEGSHIDSITTQGIIQKKSVSGSRTLPFIEILF